MFTTLKAHARRLVQAGMAALTMGAFVAPALAAPATFPSPNTSQSVVATKNTAVVDVWMLRDANEVWGNNPVLWTVSNQTGGAGPDTSYGNPCISGTGGTYVQAGNAVASDCIIHTNGNVGSFTLTASVPGWPDQPTAAFSITVTAPPTIIVNPATAAGATVGAAYSQTFTGSGGTSPYTFDISAGVLPAGMTLTSSTGVLGGMPTTAGTFNFTVRATDANGFPGTRAYTIVIAPPVMTLAPTTLPNGAVAAAYSQTLSTTGGISPYVYSLTSGTLPAGMTLSGAGVLSGTPTAGGSFTFTVTSTGASSGTGAPHTAARSYTLVISPPTVTLPATTLNNATQNVAYTATLNAASGGTSPYTYAVTAGALPAGLSLSTGGVISGTPTTFGTFNFAVTAVDSSTGTGPYASAPRGYAIQVAQAPAPNLAINDVNSAEGNAGTTTHTFTVSLSAPAPAGGVTFDIATLDGTATAADNDFVAKSLTAQTIPAGSSSYSFAVTINGDTKFEINEIYAVNVTNVTGATVTDGQGLGTITNDDTAPSISIGDVTAAEGNSGFTSFTFTLTQSAVSGVTSTVSYATQDGSAAWISDYSSTTGNVTFLRGETVQTITILVDGDVTYENDETFLVNLGSPTNATIADGQGVGTITNDDQAPYIGISDATVSEGNSGQTMMAFTVQLAPASAVTSTVDFQTADGTALSPSDYTATSGTLTFGPGVISQTINVFVNGDTQFEQSEAFYVDLSNPVNLQITNPRATGTINNDDSGVFISTTSLPDPAAGAAYSQTLAATGGNAPISFAVTSGALPSGLTLSSGGVLSGTPTATGSFTFGITATDATTPTPSTHVRSYTVTVSSPVLNLSPASGALPGASAGTAYSQTFTASNGTSPYAYAIATGVLPSGITLSTGGVLSGTPAVSGTFNFSVRATDSTGGDGPYSIIQAYSLTVGLPSPPVTSSFTAPAVAYNPGSNITTGISVAGNTTGIVTTYSVGSMTTANGGSVTINSAGLATYTPPVGFRGNDSFTYTAANSGGSSSPRTVTVPVNNPSFTASPDPLNLQAGVATSQQLTFSGGRATYSVSNIAGLPPGISLSSSGAFSGTPTSTGTFTVTYNLTDSSIGTGPFTQGLNVAINIAAPSLGLSPVSGALPGATAGTAYSQGFTASGGNGPYAYALDVGSFPPGLTLTGGTLSGTPTQAGTFNFVIRATDSTAGGGPYGVSEAYSLTVSPPTITLSPAAGALPGVEAGTAYSQTFTASGGVGPHTYTIAAGALPAGLTLAANGTLSGTPTAAGTFNFTATATDALGFTGSAAYSLTVTAPTITVTPSTVPDGTVGFAYSQTVTATGGVGSKTFSLSAGALPVGLSFSSAGVLSGTPTSTGTFNITVTATDTLGFTGARAYSFTVVAPVITLAPGALPGATQFAAYSQTITASGGAGSYTYSLSSGALPVGLSFSSAGQLSGTPSVYGSFNFTVQATDSFGSTGTQAYTLAITQSPPTITSLAPTSGPTAGGTTVLISGANYVNVSSVTFGGAPAAFVITPGGAISATTPARAAGAVDVVVTTPGGTATAAGAYTYVDPGAVRFVINNEDDGSYVFTSPTAALNFTVTTSGGSGSSAAISLFPGTYALSFTTPAGTGLATASCAPSASTVNVANRTASLVIAPAATTVCTIEAVPSVRATTEMIGAALDASSRLVIANAPTLARRLDRLNGGGGTTGTASAFGKTFASNLPFTANAGENQITFAMSLSGLRQHADADHRFNAANDNGVPASLAASVTPASGLAATAAGDASASLATRSGPRFDIWVEGLIAQFNAAASSDGSFAIVHAGADYLVSDNVLIGVGIQGDWLDMNTATGSLDSSGWLAGPYLTARLAPNLYLDARAAWGGASFDVSPFGTYTDTVDSDRELYSAALIGEFDMGTLTIRPEARVTWYKEVTDAYVDSLSVAIPSVEIKTGEVTFGPSFEWTVTRPSGSTLIPTISFDLIWTFQQDNTATAFTGAPGLDDTGLRGRIETGLAYTSAGGVSVGGSLFYDGIGGGDFEAWGGKANIRFGF